MAQIDHWQGISEPPFPPLPLPEVREDPAVASWLRRRLDSHETAWHFFHRVRAERLTTGISFLDQQQHGRVPLRPGRILEVAGPSGSAKSELLLQIAAVSALQSQLAAAKHTQNGELELGPRWRVFLLDLDLKFDACRLQTIVRDRVRALVAEGETLLPPEEDSLVSQCMDAVLSPALPDEPRLYHRPQGGRARPGEGGTGARGVLAARPRRQHRRFLLGGPSRAPGPDAEELLWRCPASLVSETVAAQLQRLVHRQRALVVVSKTQLFRAQQQPHQQQHQHQAAEQAGMERQPSALDGAVQLPQWREHMSRAWKDCVMQRLLLGATVTAASGGGPVEPVFMAQWDAAGQKEGDEDRRSPVCFMIQEGLITVA